MATLRYARLRLEAAVVHSISDGGGLYRHMVKLTEDMREMRVEMRRMAEENKKLKFSGWGDEGRIASPVPVYVW